MIVQPQPGDRVEVAIPQPDGSRWLLTRGVLVGHTGADCIMLCDPHGSEEARPGTYRKDQVFPETSELGKIETSIRSIEEHLEHERARAKRRWFKSRTHDVATVALAVGLEALRTAGIALRNQLGPKANFAHQIVRQTTDGLCSGDDVVINVARDSGGGTARGTFICDFQGWRFFRYKSGSATAYPLDSGRVTKA